MKLSIVGIMAAIAGAAAVAAQDPAPGSLKTSLNVGLSLAEGNSKNRVANLALLTEGEKPRIGSVRAGLEGNYGEARVGDARETTVENARAFANARKTLNERTFAYADGAVLHDDIADIAYRATLGPGAGVYLIKNDATSLSAETGLSYVWEKVAGTRDDFIALRLAESFTRQLSATAKLWQSLEALPRVEDLGNYLLKAEIGIEAAINTRLSLRIAIQDQYDSDPAPDAEKNDVSLVAGISFRWP